MLTSLNRMFVFPSLHPIAEFIMTPNGTLAEMNMQHAMMQCTSFKHKRDASVRQTLGCLWYVLQKIRRH